MIFITTWWGTDCMVTRLLRAKVLAWVLLLIWGFFLTPNGALLQWEALFYGVIGLSTLIPMGFLGLFFFGLSAYILVSLYGIFLFVFLYPSTYSPASLIPLHQSLESG